MKTLLKAIPFLLLYVLPQIAFSSEIQGRVPGVCDGKPISVLNNGDAKPVRLHGIDCPEKGQDLGARAKLFTSDLCFGKVVRLDVRDRDRCERIVADARLADGRLLNRKPRIKPVDVCPSLLAKSWWIASIEVCNGKRVLHHRS